MALSRAANEAVETWGNVNADDVARRVLDAGVAPAVAAGWSRRARQSQSPASRAWVREVGGATTTYFDLASLTKPLTAVAVARATGLRARVLGDVLPALADARTADVPIELLLAHRSGLEANAALFEPMLRGEAVDVASALRAAANALRGDALAGGARPLAGYPPLYSDLGYVLVGEALARHVGAVDAGEAIDGAIASPLGLRGTLGSARELEGRGVPLALIAAAPTEVVAWRGGEIRGRAHDENAWALTGLGASGHAGIFGTVDAVLTFGEAVLDALSHEASATSRVLPFGEAVDLSWLVAERPLGTLRAGFDGKSPNGSSAGALCGPNTFGHLGFTGTSVWLDPDAGTVVTLLTNRVHPTRDNLAIRAARPRAHDALFARARSMVADAARFGVP